MLSPAPQYRSVYAYPWDLAPSGGSGFGELVSEQGISAVTLALSYHAGKFISPRRKHVYFPEDGAVYFNPTASLYGRIKPHPHPDQELRRVATHLADSAGLDLHAWMVLFHNTRLGTTYPEATVRNAWGDRYIYSLCPVNPEVADYGGRETAAAVKGLAELGIRNFAFYNWGFLRKHDFARVGEALKAIPSPETV